MATQIQEGDVSCDCPCLFCFIDIALSLFHCCLQLFHFDLEVQPILEVLVGKTVEQALLEVMEEEELAALRAQQVLMLSQCWMCFDLWHARV